MGNFSARRLIEICRSRITIRSTASMFSSAVMVDRRPISGCSFEATFWVAELSHPVGDDAVRWSRVLVNIIQLLANFGTQVKEYETVPAGIHRKSPEHGSRTPAGKFSEFFPVTSDRFLAASAGKWSECAGKNPDIFRPEYGFHVPVTSGVFLQDPAFFPSLSCRFLRHPVTRIFDLGSIQPFPGEELYDCSMLNIQHFSKMKTQGSQNIIFSYEGNAPIGPKFVYLKRNPPSIE